MDSSFSPRQDCEMYGETQDNQCVCTDVQLQHRATREFVPADKKDEKYWFKRVRNNASARKSRMKRKALDKVMEKKLFALEKENQQLKNELAAMNIMFLQSRNSGNAAYNIAQELKRNGSLQLRDDKSDNGSTYEGGSRSSSFDQDDQSSTSSGKSEMDDFRNETNTPPVMENYLRSYSAQSIVHGIYPSLYNNANIGLLRHQGALDQLKAISQHIRQSAGYMTYPKPMVGIPSEMSLFPYMISSKVEDDRGRESDDSRDDDTDVKRVPHKIRIKERVHSAFTKHPL